jgi:hypothetical protein
MMKYHKAEELTRPHVDEMVVWSSISLTIEETLTLVFEFL